MPTDLTKVNDHPVPLIGKEWPAAADFLRWYEQGKGVTFAALDNDALARVREAYALDVAARTPEEMFTANADLVGAGRDLLGLED